jgi:ornithine carbamoyltransferase
MMEEERQVKPNHLSDGIAQLKGKDFLSLAHLHTTELLHLLHFAKEMKRKQKNGLVHPLLAGKTMAMMFDQPSTRTRVSFEVGLAQLGGHALHLSRHELQLGRGETVEDTAQILSRYVDVILIRTFQHELVQALAHAASVPVINGLTDLYHPCQTLTDLFTLQEEKGELAGLKLAYIGDGNNVLHSLLQGAALAGIHLAIATPPGYEPSRKVWQEAEALAQQTGATLTFSHDPMSAVQQADAVYTDVWASMGLEKEKEKRKQDFQSYQVNAPLMALAKKEAIFMHCLPAYRGLEVAAEVIDGAQSVVLNQGENRLHVQKALLVALLG